MNPDVKAFPNYIDPKVGGGISRYARLAAQLHWGWENSLVSFVASFLFFPKYLV